jgi:hypothetical protein
LRNHFSFGIRHSFGESSADCDFFWHDDSDGSADG